MSKKKILWFIPGATTPDLKALAKANGLTIRNPLAFSEGSGLEDCDAVTGMVPKAYASEFDVVDEPEGCSWQAGSLRHDGPTVAEYVEAGYQASNYPPAGFAPRSAPEEIAAAVAAQASVNPDGKMLVADIRAALTELGVTFDPKAGKPELAALLATKRAEAESAAEVEKLRAELAAKGMEAPEGATLEDLQKLLDEAA